MLKSSSKPKAFWAGQKKQSGQNQLKFWMHNFFACQHREQRAPTKGLYGHGWTNKSTVLHKATNKQELSLACNLFHNNQVLFSKHVFFRKQRLDALFPCPRKWTFVSLPTTVCPLSHYSELFSSESIWKQWCQIKKNNPFPLILCRARRH